MKKLLLFVAILFIPVILNATSKYGDYTSMNFVETLKQENIELINKNYKENDNQAIIYMFRGKTCSYCKSFLNFLNSISNDYGNKFKLVSFEVWEDQKNSELLKKFAYVTEQEVSGVPFIVIGNKIFPGYSSEYDAKIKEAINEEYKNKNKNNVMPEALKVSNDKIKDDSPSSASGDSNESSNENNSKNDNSKNDNSNIIIWNFIFQVISTGVIIALMLNLHKKEK